MHCINGSKSKYSFFLECGRTFQENSASFTSPSYFAGSPGGEPESCEWRITATHGEKIVLNITDLVRFIRFSFDSVASKLYSFNLLLFFFILGHFQIQQLSN